MKRLEIRPDGWPVKLKDCPAGFFIYWQNSYAEGQLCFKSEYEESEVFNSAGEYFRPPIGSVKTAGNEKSYLEAVVQPVEYVWTDDE
jgi:hypothetical protein